MAKNRRDIKGICRLCLCNDENILFPATKLTDSSLTVDDIERFTGIRVVTRESTPYAVCIDCKNKLRKFNNYRSFCLRNDVKFRKLFAVPVEDTTEAAADMAKPQYATSRCDNTSPSDIIDENNFMNSIDETTEFIENEENSIDETEKSIHTVLNYVDVDGNLCHSIAYGDNDMYMQKPPTGNDSSCQPSDQLDSRERPNLITTFIDTNTEASNTELKKEKELCMLCGKLVTSLAAHMVTHTTEMNYACGYCAKKYSRKSYLREHVLCVHLKKVKKICKLCDKGFSYFDSYVAHMRAKHNFGEPFECSVCNLKFRHRGGLRNHTNRKHNLASNCECTICGMKFEDKTSLRDHGRVHSDEQPFACKYCPKRFKSPTACKTHQLIHEGIKFPCTLCDKIYSYKTLLNSHMKKTHASDDTASPANP